MSDIPDLEKHFACPAYVQEGWGPHSFAEDPQLHFRCGGEEVASGPNATSEH